MHHFRPISTSFCLFLAVFLIGNPVISHGQQPRSPTAESTKEAGVDLSTPRAAVATFYDAMGAVRGGKDERLSDAIGCLDLEDVPAPEQGMAGEDLANRLYDVLDRLVFSLEAIPEQVTGDRYTCTLGTGGTSIELEMRRNAAGRWRFGYKRTLAKLEQLEPELAAAAAVEEEQNGDEAFDPRFQSPRATLRTFITSVSDWKQKGMVDAVDAFDLSGLGAEEVRAEKGAELAVQLMTVLNRTRYVRYYEIPNDPHVSAYRLLQDRVGNVDLKPVTNDEGVTSWKFSAGAVDSIPALYDYYRNAPLVPEVKQENLPRLTSLRLRDWVRDTAPFMLKRPLFLENWQWFGLLVIILVGMALSRLLAFVLVLLVRRWFRRERLHLDRNLEKDFVRPIRIAFMAWVWLLGLTTLGLPVFALTYLKIGAKSVTAAAAVWAIYRLVDILGKYLTEKAAKTETRFDDLLVPFLTRGLKVFVVVFGVVFVAETLHFDYKSVLAGLGLGGLAFALAAKDTVANVFGSLTILLDRPFQIGDWVVIGDTEGSVESVGMRSTRIRTFYNSLISVPNSQLINASIDNMGARRYRRIKGMIAVTYDTPPEKIDAFCEGIRELIREHPYTRKDYYHVYFNEFGASSLNILLYCFHETPDWPTELRERHRLFADIVRLAHRLGVEFAFPTQTLYMRRDETPAPSKPGPLTTDDAMVLGRNEAAAIVESTLGRNAPVPPPVSIQDVQQETEDPTGEGEDGDV